jgi:hypothetical protein
MEEQPEKTNVRFIVWRDAVYLRKEDVITMVLAVAYGEETDVRNRQEELADNINKVGEHKVGQS